MNRWYAAYTQPRNEALAIEHLEYPGDGRARFHSGNAELLTHAQPGL